MAPRTKAVLTEGKTTKVAKGQGASVRPAPPPAPKRAVKKVEPVPVPVKKAPAKRAPKAAVPDLFVAEEKQAPKDTSVALAEDKKQVSTGNNKMELEWAKIFNGYLRRDFNHVTSAMAALSKFIAKVSAK